MLLWPINLVYLMPLAAGMGAWLLIDRPGRARDVAASALVATALMSFALGVPVALGILTRLVLDRSLRRRAWIAALPLGLFAVWYLTFGQDNPSPQTSFSLSNLPDVPGYMWDMAVAAGAGLTGLGEPFRQISVALLGIAVLARVFRSGLSPGLTAALVALLSFWGLTALSRADLGYPASSRYIYPSVVFVLLVLCELPAATGRKWADTLGDRRRWRSWPSWRAWPWSATSTSCETAGAPAQRGRQHRSRPCCAGGREGEIDPAHRPQPRYAPQVSAGQYLEAVRDLGSALPGGLTAPLRDQSQAITIDTRLWVAEEIGVRPAAGGRAGRAKRARGGARDHGPSSRPRWLHRVRPHPDAGRAGRAPARRARPGGVQPGPRAAGMRLRRFSQTFSTGPAFGVVPPRSNAR